MTVVMKHHSYVYLWSLFRVVIVWLCVCLVVIRWNGLQEEIVERLKSSKGLFQLWQSYKDLYRQSDTSVQNSEERANQLLKSASRKDITEEEVSTWIQDCAVSPAFLFICCIHLKQSCVIDVLWHYLPSGAVEISGSGSDVSSGFTGAGRATQTAGGHVGRRLHPVRSPDARSTPERCRAESESTAGRAAGEISEHVLVRSDGISVRYWGVLLVQAGVRDYETFNEQLDSLSRWIVEAEEILEGQDPNGSSDQSLIRDRMEELKVNKWSWLNYSHVHTSKSWIC